MMKKIILAAAVVGFSSGAFAQATGNACVGTGVASPVGSNPAVASEFVQVQFTPKCSANTYVAFAQSQTAFGVAAASSKGKNYFIGNSNGGGVRVDSTAGACPANGCTAGQVTTSASTALNAS